MAINKSALLKQMVKAAKVVLEDSWPDLKEVAIAELRGIAEGVKTIEKLRLQGKISQRQAKLLLRMKRNTAQIVLLSFKGMGLIVVENALNAAFKVVRDTVNTVLGFRLI